MKTTDKNITFKPTLLYALILSALIVLVYFKLFSANFISWDDGDVVLNNKDVHHFDIKAFFTSYYVGNYAPISMIGFAIDWFIFKGNAAGHHAMSLLFHIANGFLVYYLCKLILCIIYICICMKDQTKHIHVMQ